jgi:hypothetical protein
MRSAPVSVCNLCLGAAALGVVVGCVMVVVSFLVSPPTAMIWRFLVLPYFLVYFFAVAFLYVVIGTNAPPSARLTGWDVNIYAGLPDKMRLIALVVCFGAFAAFFIAIALVEFGTVTRSVGELGIYGTFFIGAFCSMVCGTWSARTAALDNDA